MIKYTELDNGYILMDNDGVISTIPNDLGNSDYQRYLNPEAEQSTQPIGGNN
jgi:hypothetical protein